MMPEDTQIWIVTEETVSDEGGKGDRSRNPWDTTREGITRTVGSVRVSAATLERNMREFLAVVGGIFQQAETEMEQRSGMQLDEVELSVEINGEGEVKLLGSGGKAAAKGAITLKFKRTER